MRRHCVGAHFGEVAPDHAVVETVEEQQQAELHGHVGLHEEEQREAEERRHDHHVAHEAQDVRRLVDQEEPLVDTSARGFVTVGIGLYIGMYWNILCCNRAMYFQNELYIKNMRLKHTVGLCQQEVCAKRYNNNKD